jgi:hypothetical protein
MNVFQKHIEKKSLQRDWGLNLSHFGSNPVLGAPNLVASKLHFSVLQMTGTAWLFNIIMHMLYQMMNCAHVHVMA